MAVNDAIMDKILAYLQGELSQAEKEKFEQELSQHPEWQSRLDEAKKAIEILEIDRRFQLRQEWDQMNHAKVTPLFPFRRRLAIAAVLTLLAIGTGILFLQNRNDNIQNAFSPYPAPGVLLSPTEDSQSLINTAYQAYTQEDYATSIEILEKVKTSGSLKTEVYFYLGNSYFATKEYKTAASSFQHVIDQNDEAFREAAEWYLALSYLALGEKEKGERIMDNLAKTSNDIYGEKAREWLK